MDSSFCKLTNAQKRECYFLQVTKFQKTSIQPKPAHPFWGKKQKTSDIELFTLVIVESNCERTAGKRRRFKMGEG